MKKLKVGIAVRKSGVFWFFPFVQWTTNIDTDIDEMTLTYKIRKAIDEVLYKLEKD